MEQLNKRIYKLVYENFAEYEDWSVIESDIVRFCSKLPTYLSPGLRDEAVEIIEEIKKFLKENIASKKSKLKFLEKEIEFLKKVDQKATHITTVNTVDPKTIKIFEELTYDTEGVIGIEGDYNFEQLKYLSKKIHNKNQLCKFFISTQNIVRGKIMSEQYDHYTTIPVVTEVYNKSKDQNEIYLFSENVPNSMPITKQIQVSFYIYRFVDTENREMMLFSIEPLEIGDVTIKGLITHVNDKKVFGETAKLHTVLPILFAQEVSYRTPKFSKISEFKKWFSKFEDKEWFNTPFCIYHHRMQKYLQYEYFDWFKDMIWAFHLHTPMGTRNLYPMHFMIVGSPGTGKSDLLNNLHDLSQETVDVFSGSSSTMKNLIPTFKDKPPQMGYLAKANRFAYCDEFFRVLLRNGGTLQDEGTSEILGTLNDLLEHQKRDMGSGVSRINVKMTARMLATSNPLWNIKDLKGLSEKIDNAFLSRIMFYFQQPEDVELVQRKGAKISNLRLIEPALKQHDWLAIIDFMQSVESQIDDEEIEKIYNSMLQVIPQNIVKNYESRQRHHLECIADGIIKLNFLKESREDLVGRPEDYEQIHMIWKKLVSSWFNSGDMRVISNKEKLQILPEYAKTVFNHIKANPGIKTHELQAYDFEGIGDESKVKKRNNEAVIILTDNKLVFFDEKLEGYKTYLNK